jgi:hypothetical protein
MVSPIFIVGSISGWEIVTRSAPSGKWEICAKESDIRAIRKLNKVGVAEEALIRNLYVV